VYSFGVLLYELMTRKPVHVPTRRRGTPFEEAAIEQERSAMESELRDSRELRQLYPRLSPLVQSMLQRNPLARPTADAIPSRSRVSDFSREFAGLARPL
jgi:hypothetical protein